MTRRTCIVEHGTRVNTDLLVEEPERNGVGTGSDCDGGGKEEVG